MKAKRVPRTYRLREDYVRELDRIAAARDIDKTRVLEEALELYLSPTTTIMAPDDGFPGGSCRDSDAPAESPAG